jgi:hypothetical protein
MTASFAIEHPSQPNYLDLFSGANQGTTGTDAIPSHPAPPFTTPNLGAELRTAGFSFAGYSETLPSVGFNGEFSGPHGDDYARKHNPWVNWQNDAPASTNQMPSSVNQPFTSFPTDFTQLPTLAVVVPNQYNDMHSLLPGLTPPDDDAHRIQRGDTWLKNNLDGYVQWAKSHNSLLVVTWDEDDSATAANHIPTFFVGPMVQPGTYGQTINHFDVLRTLEDMYGLSYAGASASATPITAMWPGQLQFSAAAYSVPETTSTATITVTRSGGSDGTVTVPYATSDGTAKAGTNYTAASGTLTFGPGQTSQTFTVGVLDDQLVHGDGTVQLTLGQPSGGATLGSPATAVLTITEADVAGQVQFAAATASGHEKGGPITITVSRSGGTAGGVTIHYATGDGTARAGTDYTAASGTLTFGPGQTSQTFTVTPLDNGQVTVDGLTVNLTLSQPGGGATLGSTATAVLTILDDDLPSVPDSPAPSMLATAASAFAHSREHYTQFVTNAYQQYLKRLPDNAGLNAWVSGMMAGVYSDEKVEASFIGSPEYIANHGGTGQAWVSGMYKDLLGRTPSDSEVQTWLNALAQGASTTAVALGFAASPEREGQRVAANYQTYLGRAPSSSEVSLWVNIFLGGTTNESVVGGFVGSPEYYMNPQKGHGNKARWVARAYLDVLFRPASVGEVNNWLQILG